jgi:predicted transcriptional regulator
MLDVPAQVIRRYIEWLAARDLIEHADQGPGHVLSERGQALMERYLATVSETVPRP